LRQAMTYNVGARCLVGTEETDPAMKERFEVCVAHRPCQAEASSTCRTVSLAAAPSAQPFL